MLPKLIFFWHVPLFRSKRTFHTHHHTNINISLRSVLISMCGIKIPSCAMVCLYCIYCSYFIFCCVYIVPIFSCLYCLFTIYCFFIIASLHIALHLCCCNTENFPIVRLIKEYLLILSIIYNNRGSN